VGLLVLVLCALVFVVYSLGEHAGRQNPSRTEHVKEIVKLEAELKNRKSDLYSKYTPRSFLFSIVVLVIVLILMLFGGVGGDDHHYYNRRH
jgi:thiosulfate reductase cytochrome b subunit